MQVPIDFDITRGLSMSSSMTDLRIPADSAAPAAAARGAALIARMECVPTTRWHVRIRIIMGCATFFDAFDALALAFVLPALVGLWGLSAGQIGMLIATGYVGQLLGSLFCGWLAERIGRVKSEFWPVLLMSVMSLVCATAGSFHALLAFRFIQGLGVGGANPVAAVYINEMSVAHNRGRFFLMYELIFPIGLLAAGQAGAFLVPRVGWEAMFLAGGIPGLFVAALVWFLPESPRWLIGKGRFDAAECIIRQIEASTEQRIQVSPRPVPLRPAAQTNLRELFSPFYRTRTLVVWALWGTAYFVANGLNNWMPSLYRTVYHLPLAESLRLASVSNVLSVIFVLACAFLVDRVGRRRWVMAAFGIAGVLLAALYFSGAHSAYAVMLMGSTAYAVMGTATVLLFLYTPEIYPTRMRAVGTALATSWFRAASAAGPAIVGLVLGEHGVAPVFLMFSGVCVIGLLVAFGMTETRQKSLEEIAP
jgi:putative MFS transporter